MASRYAMILAALSATALGSVSQFRVFDSTAYLNTTIGYGSSHINWIPNYVCSPLTKGGVLPSADEWKSIVLDWNTYPGYPLVLDCEDLYFTNETTADVNLEVLSALQTWAAEVVPKHQIIGWYGLSGNTIPTLHDHYRRLIANHSDHAFFPSAYTFTNNLTSWNNSLNTVVKNIKTINNELPVVPFTWPQYHQNYSFIPVELWNSTLNALVERHDINGFIVWGGKNHHVCDDSCQQIAGQQPWLNATRTLLRKLYGLYGGHKRKQGAAVFTGF